mmetsp:Transcript_17361/g.53919  ORF Transcript_17361/g.53919 Transcript_17361/m.53919 type:complete len:223 (+) Transcript_17361:9802-10470(+)
MLSATGPAGHLRASSSQCSTKSSNSQRRARKLIQSSLEIFSRAAEKSLMRSREPVNDSMSAFTSARASKAGGGLLKCSHSLSTSAQAFSTASNSSLSDSRRAATSFMAAALVMGMALGLSSAQRAANLEISFSASTTRSWMPARRCSMRSFTMPSKASTPVSSSSHSEMSAVRSGALDDDEPGPLACASIFCFSDRPRSVTSASFIRSRRSARAWRAAESCS